MASPLITLTNQPSEALLPWGTTSRLQRLVGVQNAVRGAVSLCGGVLR